MAFRLVPVFPDTLGHLPKDADMNVNPIMIVVQPKPVKTIIVLLSVLHQLVPQQQSVTLGITVLFAHALPVILEIHMSRAQLNVW